MADAVARLCSAWWQAELPGRDCLVPQMVPYLLYQAVTSGEAGNLSKTHGWCSSQLLLAPIKCSHQVLLQDLASSPTCLLAAGHARGEGSLLTNSSAPLAIWCSVVHVRHYQAAQQPAPCLLVNTERPSGKHWPH